MTDEELHGALIDQQGSRRDLNTPVLVLDRDALGRNIATMAEFARAHGVQLRPHAKTHKSPDIAKLQIAAGAVGLCCAKIGEAEVMAEYGVTSGLHITSPVVSPAAIARLIRLNGMTDGLMCVVDNPDNVAAIGQAARADGKALKLIIDIDPGIRRTGVASPEAALGVLRAIEAAPALHYMGVQCYTGLQQHMADFKERAGSVQDCAVLMRAIIAALTEAGAPPEIVTGGGTGTHRIDPGLGLFTELQVGSYIFMDSQYLACDLTGDGSGPPFETSLMIDARVVSANMPGMATVDAGFKAFATDAEPPVVLAGAGAGAQYFFMGDEHGAILLPEGKALALSDIVTLAAPHCDPTVNLYDNYHVVEGGTLRAIWPVAARGRSR